MAWDSHVGSTSKGYPKGKILKIARNVLKQVKFKWINNNIRRRSRKNTVLETEGLPLGVNPRGLMSKKLNVDRI